MHIFGREGIGGAVATIGIGRISQVDPDPEMTS
jgi:hypothetical protein